MRCLHTFSDWKWTGPAEPVVSLCEALAGCGIDVVLAFRQAPADFRERTGQGNRAAGYLPPVTCLNRYFSMRDWLFDVARSAGTHRDIRSISSTPT